MDPALDGAFVFGTCCRCVHSPLANAEQIDSFFGVTGVTRIDGGGRGRVFHVQGVFIGDDLPTVLAAEAVLLSYADGVVRVFTDTMSRSWDNTVFTGEYHPDPHGPKPLAGGGWSLSYRCTLRTLA
jgi:hypothetical protein